MLTVVSGRRMIAGQHDSRGDGNQQLRSYTGIGQYALQHDSECTKTMQL